MSTVHHPLLDYFDTMDSSRCTVIWRGYKVFLFKQPWGTLAIAEQGAQILHYQPRGSQPVLWLSAQSAGPGKAIRGGIPLCWPWFGSHPERADQPSHGLARTAKWSLTGESHQTEQSEWVLDAPSLMENILLQLRISASPQRLQVHLRTENTGQGIVTVTQALHSYLQLSDTRNIDIQGPENAEFYDKLEQRYARRQAHSWALAMDRIYQHQGDTQLSDKGLDRRLRIAKESSKSTVIWNPGPNTSLTDIEPSELSKFICIEAANTEEYDSVTLHAGENFSIGTTIECTPNKK
ncbi:D-hexose-6-phosphate mutarotase [Pseudoteredinibacter isoporae]|uniref:D-hexose-6-phosphate mutarotase n=1 Tax=Pseudoteredinibacter isoporae TaxID=570281 RepID=UPI003102D624